jgi:hypothetical protein
LQCVLADAAAFQPEKGTTYAAILSDMNGDARESIGRVIRLSKHLRQGGLVVFTLKMPGLATFAAANEVAAAVVGMATEAGLRVLARTHLSYNRHELTLFFEKQAAGAPAGKNL